MKTIKKYLPTIIFIVSILSDAVFKLTAELDLSENGQIIFKALGIVLWVITQKINNIKKEESMILVEKEPTEKELLAIDKAKEILLAEGLELIGTRPTDR